MNRLLNHLLRFSTAALLLITLFPACQKETIPIEEPERVYQNPETRMDLSYGKSKSQKMDLYLPGGRSNKTTRIVLILHGGGWFQGDKEEMQLFVPQIEKWMKEYAIVNMNYRLVNFSPQYMLPTQTDDIRSVMDHLANHSSDYGVKPEFVLLGFSAGGHLSMLYAYHYDEEKRVKAIVNMVGPCDLTDPAYTDVPLYTLGMNYIIDKSKLPSGMEANRFASPVTWMSPSSAPIISFYGKSDGLVPNSQYEALETKCRENHIPYEIHLYDGGHDIGQTNSEEVIGKAAAFVRKYVK